MEEIKTYREMDMIRSNMREYKDGEWVKYSDHKAVVDTMQEEHARSLWIKDDVIGDLKAIIEEKKKVIMLLKAENYDLTKRIK